MEELQLILEEFIMIRWDIQYMWFENHKEYFTYSGAEGLLMKSYSYYVVCPQKSFFYIQNVRCYTFEN
jgi:hypothetical protein